MVHIVDALQKGHSYCLIHTADTDVIVILRPSLLLTIVEPQC